MKPAIFFTMLMLCFVALAQQDEVVLTQEQRIAIQHGLADAGHDPGAIDGAFGNSTRAAIWDWQNAGDGVAATGYLSETDAEILLEAGMKRMLSLGLTFEGGEAQPVNPFRAATEGTSPPPVPEDERVIHFPQGNLCKTKDVLQDDNPEYCWVELTDKPGCYSYIPSDIILYGNWSEATVHGLTWSGTCDGDLVSGHGIFRVEAVLVDGRFSGIEEGSYVDGKRNGPWIERTESTLEPSYYDRPRKISSSFEGSYLDGKRHGPWKSNLASGSYVNGKLHGPWKWDKGYRAGTRGSYVDGKRHGTWVNCYDKDCKETIYVDGEEVDD